jgi:SPP1 family phage portal protein
MEQIENTAANTTENAEKTIAGFLFGRRDIFTSVDELTEENVVGEVNSAIVYHMQNVLEEEYLYWYRRGLQPILHRKKERNDFINNKVTENHYDEIVTFKNGYFLMEPAFYISRKDGKKSKVDKLNEYLYRSGKQEADNQLADWFHMVGKAALYVESNDDPDIPVKAYALDPRSAFVVYSLRPGRKPAYGVNMVIHEGNISVDVFTDSRVFRLSGSAIARTTTPYPEYESIAIALDSVEPNPLGHIPIIEYRYNSVNMAAPECVMPLLDAINTVRSNQVDGIEQFIQSIAVAVNCQFEEGTTANQIKKAGMIALKSIGENKADFKILSEELDQQQTQTLVDSLYEQALRICSMPLTTKGGRSTSDTGSAVIFRDGWEQAGSAARNTEDLFKESNHYFDIIFTDILRKKGILDIKLVDFKLNFVRNETANVQSKAQAMQTMLAAGLHPELALAKSGISNDPVSDLKMSEKYMRMIWGDPDEAVKTEKSGNGEGEAVIIEEDNNNGENATGGV